MGQGIGRREDELWRLRCGQRLTVLVWVPSFPNALDHIAPEGKWILSRLPGEARRMARSACALNENSQQPVWDSGNTDLILGPKDAPSPSSLEQPPLSSWPEALPIIPEPLMGKAELTAPWGG